MPEHEARDLDNEDLRIMRNALAGGIPLWRVATALGLAGHDLARVEAELLAEAEPQLLADIEGKRVAELQGQLRSEVTEKTSQGNA